MIFLTYSIADGNKGKVLSTLLEYCHRRAASRLLSLLRVHQP